MAKIRARLQDIASVFLLAVCLLVGLMVATAIRRPADTFDGGSTGAEVVSAIAAWETSGETYGSGILARNPALPPASTPSLAPKETVNTYVKIPNLPSTAVVQAEKIKSAVAEVIEKRAASLQGPDHSATVAAIKSGMANAKLAVDPATACSLVRASSPDGLDPICAGSANVGGKLFFGDNSMSTNPINKNSSDPYYLEKVASSHNNSSLRLTINDDPDESFQIWGNSCAAGNCGGQGTMAHVFKAGGDASHRGNVNVGKKLFFGDESISTKPNGQNSSDPYYLEKVVSSGNNSSLRLTINDDADESFQIWGNACGVGDCFGQGTQAHKFRADGTASHTGSLNVGVQGTATDHGWTSGAYPTGGSLNIFNRHANNWTHLPWVDGRNYIRNNTQVDGTFTVNTGDGNWNWLHVRGNHGDNLYVGSDHVNRGIWADGNRPVGMYHKGTNRLDVSADSVKVNGQLCVGGTCITESQLNKMVAPYVIRPVSVLGAYNMTPWNSGNFADRTASWIWNDPAAASSAGKKCVSFQKTFASPKATPVTVHVIVDEHAIVFLNNVVVGHASGGWGGGGYYTKLSAVTLGGSNVIRVQARSTGGPAGLLVSVMSTEDGSVLDHTDGSWGWFEACDKASDTVVKWGNNGTVSCDQFCSGSWSGGPQGACIQGSDSEIGPIECWRVLAAEDGRLHNVSCECEPRQYIFDLLSSSTINAAVAIFGMRLYRKEHAGPVVKVRRSTDNLQQDFYAAPTTTGKLTTQPFGAGMPYSTWIGSAAGYVTVWYDQSGKGSHVTQSNPSRQPTLTKEGKLLFKGAQFLEKPYNKNVNDGKFTYIVRCVCTNVANGKHQSPITSRGDRTGYIFYKHPDNAFYHWNGANGGWQTLNCGVKCVQNAVYTVSGSYNGSVMTTTVNGTTASAKLQLTPNTTSPFRVGAGATENPSGEFFWNGEISNVMYFNTSLSTTEINTILETA